MTRRRPFRDLIDGATRSGKAIGAFTAYDLWQLRGIVLAAHRLSAPVVVLASATMLSSDENAAMIASFQAYLRRVESSILIQADHLPSPAHVTRAWSVGVDAVLADGSRRPLPENEEFVRKARAAARAPRAVGIEAELGRVDGDEDRATTGEAGRLTDPAEVRGFVDRSGTDCLAVSVGNRHGVYLEPPELDWERLAAIHAASPVPLALHGATGLSAEDLRHAISMGVGKINFNTELRESYFAQLAQATSIHVQALDIASLGLDLTNATATTVESKLRVLGWG